jgi:hydroxylamine dehydrogenase
MGDYADIMDMDTTIRETADLKNRIAALEAQKQSSLLIPDTNLKKASLGGLGVGMLLAGMLLAGYHRRKRNLSKSRES